MKLQDLHPYDSAVVGLNNIYRVDYKGDFFINAPFIISPNKKISTGSTYVLIYAHPTKKCIVHQVRLQDAYYSEGIINLIVQDILSQEIFTIDQKIKCTREHLKWVLIDLDYLVDEHGHRYHQIIFVGRVQMPKRNLFLIRIPHKAQ